MRFERDGLMAAVSRLPLHKQVLFALLCAERTHACCWAFGEREGRDVSPYFEGCEAGFDQLARDTGAPSSLDELKARLDEAVPRSDEFGYPLAIQAQSGMIALMCALDLWTTQDPAEARDAGASIVDAWDNYEYHLHKTIAGTKADPKEYLSLDREIAWQQESVERLERAGSLDAASIVGLRILNRAFGVLPAV